MSSISVLRVIYDLQVGGVQRMLLKAIPLLRDKGIETEICCLKQKGELESEFAKQKIKVHLIPFISRLDPIGLFRLRSLVKKGKFDIVHSHMYASNIAVNIALLGMRGIKIINSYHSQTPVSGSGQGRMLRWTKGIPDVVVAVSNSVKLPIVELGIAEEKIAVIYNGVDCPPAPIPFAKRDDNSPIEIVWAGRFVKAKRADRFLDLMQLCKDKNVPAHLTLVGDGPKWNGIKTRIGNAGLDDMITLVGWQSDIKPYVDNADIYLSMSEREGFPNTILEVCGRGRPFLVRDIPPNREVYESSAGGFLFNDDLHECFEVIKKLQQDRKKLELLGLNAFKIAQKFSIENNLEKTVRMYKGLLNI